MPNRGLPRPRRAACPARLFLLGLLALPAAAAEAPPEAMAPPASGSVTRFEDWKLACPGACRIETAVRGERGAQVLHLRLDGPESARTLVVETPLPLYLPDGLTLAIGEAEPRAAPWRTCGPEGCEARLPADPSLLETLRRQRSAIVGFTLVDGARVRLPVSLMGFTAAERALGAETATARPR
jgi:invasion protein IalB